MTVTRVVEVVDSHTGGEPTRVVVSGGPDLGTGSLAERARVFRDQCDDFRRAVIEEPRGNDVLVGALLVAPDSPDAVAGVIFFNNVGPLGMCGHGTIGLGVALKHLGRVGEGAHRIDTPVGPVTATIETGPYVAVENVPSWRLRAKVPVELPDGQRVHGDIAWGGNWFFLCDDHEQAIELSRVEALTEYAWTLRQALTARGVTGANGAEIDHIELFGPPSNPDVADSRNFVLCPGKAYDRSPCGTGTSAKAACLAADGKLLPGRVWRQESVVGSVFEATYRVDGDRIVPTVRGSAFITAESRLLLDPSDPFVHGVRRT